MKLGIPIKKILAIKLRSLGDTLIFTSSLNELKRAYPNAEIHVVATRPWDSLIENHPAVKKIWGYTRHEDPAARAKTIASLALKLRKEKFDAVINFHASPSSAMLSFATGAPVRSIHFHGHRDANRYSTVTIPGKGVLKPIIERDWDAIRALGVSIDPITESDTRLPQVFITQEEKTSATQNYQVRAIKAPVLLLGLGASRSTKCWPMNYFSEIAMKWNQETKGSVLAVVASNEGKLAEDFLSQVKGGAGTPFQVEQGVALRDLAARMSIASVFLGNDSGPKHLAVSVGLPTVTVFGPEDPFEWHPYPKALHPYFFIESLTCRKDADPGMPPWCGIQTCTVEKHRCMTEILPAQVFQKVKEVHRS